MAELVYATEVRITKLRIDSHADLHPFVAVTVGSNILKRFLNAHVPTGPKFPGANIISVVLG